MLKRLALLGTTGLMCALAAPAGAVVITPGSSGLTFDPFNVATQGTQLAFTSVPGTALTFSAIMRSAVYRNTLGTLDFYYQVARTGAGSTGDQMIDAFTAAAFDSFRVEGFVSAADIDGAGAFTAANNPPSSTTTTGRNATGNVLQTDFGTNGLMGNEISAIYIFRTNATSFGAGTFGVIDGSSYSGVAFAPTPEPAAWLTMILGMGMVGGAIRYRRRKTAVSYA